MKPFQTPFLRIILSFITSRKILGNAFIAKRVLDDARVQRKRSWVFKLDLRKLMILEKMLWVEVGKLDFWVFLLQLFGENECQV